MNFVTIDELNCEIRNKLNLIPRTVDIVIGVPRSGMLVASLIALYLNLPLSDLDSFVKGEIYSLGKTKKNVDWISDISEARQILIVEDSSYTGASIREAKQRIQDSPYKDRVVFLAAIVTKDAKKLVDISFMERQPPRVFEWNMFHHQLVSRMCFDLDGVLCEDPTDEQNDDGEKYIDFVLNAPLKVKPTFEIGYIVTSRLEKYRDITEQWLKNNGIRYKELIMMQYKTKEERILYETFRYIKLWMDSNWHIGYIRSNSLRCSSI